MSIQTKRRTGASEPSKSRGKRTAPSIPLSSAGSFSEASEVNQENALSTYRMKHRSFLATQKLDSQAGKIEFRQSHVEIEASKTLSMLNLQSYSMPEENLELQRITPR